jgi:hypothetical protein
MTEVKKLYRKNKNGEYVFLGHVPDTYPLDENEKFEDMRRLKMENKKMPQSDKIGTFKINENGNLVWEDATYGHTVFTAEQVEAIKFLINEKLR